MKTKAFIFDFDGTLVNSEFIHFESWKLLLKDEYNLNFEEQDYFQNFAGIPTIEIASQVKERYDIQSDIVEIAQQKELVAKEKLAATTVKFMPYAKEVIYEVCQWGIPISIVTGSSRSEIEPVLKKAGIFELFDYTITRDDVSKSKPDPQGYLMCAKLMKFESNEYMVFEDTWAGVTAAKKAFLPCFGIQKIKAYRSKLIDAGADKVFGNLKEAFDFLKEDKGLLLET